MSLVPPIEYDTASPEVRAVYDDIMATRKVPSVNNFWKVLAPDPANLVRVWQQVKSVMGNGALDPLVNWIERRGMRAAKPQPIRTCRSSSLSSTPERRGPSPSPHVKPRIKRS